MAEAPKTQAKTAELRLLASGASISGANGIHFGPDGMFYRDISLQKHIKARVEQVTG